MGATAAASVVAVSTSLVMLAGLLGCDRPPAPTRAPAAVAYADGFEVVVFDLRDGIPANVRSLPLRSAEQAIASGAQALISDAGLIQQAISTGKSGDSHAIVSVQALGERKQQIRLSFHESMRTYVYEYTVDGTHVRPTSSEYCDLGKTKIVQYSSD